MFNLLPLKVHEYLADSIKLVELEEWIAPRLPYLHDAQTPELRRLLGIIQLGLSEIDAGILSEEQFKKILRETPEINMIWARYPEEHAVTITSYANDFYFGVSYEERTSAGSTIHGRFVSI